MDVFIPLSFEVPFKKEQCPAYIYLTRRIFNFFKFLNGLVILHYLTGQKVTIENKWYHHIIIRYVYWWAELSTSAYYKRRVSCENGHESHDIGTTKIRQSVFLFCSGQTHVSLRVHDFIWLLFMYMLFLKWKIRVSSISEYYDLIWLLFIYVLFSSFFSLSLTLTMILFFSGWGVGVGFSI